MAEVWNWLAGKKTYIVAVLSLVYYWSGVASGHIAVHDAMQATQVALIGAALKNGMAKK